MNSYIFSSHACKACDEQPFERHEREVLRTQTEDICCTCGAVLQTFPKHAGVVPSKDIITIPPAVSKILEQLLKRRLFILGRGVNPQRPQNNLPMFDIDRVAKTLVHRAGDQLSIDMRGPANCTAVLRWNYSSKSLLPRYPWQEIEGYWNEKNNYAYREKSELKPTLSGLDVQRPARIVRACDVLSEMEFTGLYIDKRQREERSLRFEQRIELDEQPLDTTADLCLIIKVELSWLQVGSTFPDDGGPRLYNLSCHYQGYPQTAEEAVDAAIFAATHAQSRENVTIHHKRDRLAVVTSVGDPIRAHRQANYYTHNPRQFHHNSWLRIHGGADDYIGAFITSDNRYLVPAGRKYELEVSTPQTKEFAESRALPQLSVLVKCGEEVIAERQLGGPEHKSGFSQYGYNIGYYCELEGKIPSEAGKTITVRIETHEGVEERVYEFVSLKDYEKAWDDWRNPIIDAYKRQVLAQIAYNDRCWTTGKPENSEFQPSQKIAALVGGRWLEGTYVESKNGQSHVVAIRDHSGEAQWEVSYVKSLSDALTEGLNVVPPFNAEAPHGAQAKRISN